MSPPPTPTPVAAAYRKDHYTVVTSTYPPLFPLLLEAPAQRARPYDRVRIQSLSASQEAAGQPLESLTQSSWYHSLSPTIGNTSTQFVEISARAIIQAILSCLLGPASNT